MLQWLEAHPELYEILRYLIAGGLTTLVSLVTHYFFCFLLVKRDPCAAADLKGKISWIGRMINKADARQLAVASVVSWVLAVLFAFWINRGMVFRMENSGNGWQELGKFAAGRVVSYLLFELGLAQLFKRLGMNNLVNRIAVTVLVTIFNYGVSKFIVF